MTVLAVSSFNILSNLPLKLNKKIDVEILLY
jgi:hypothetical protein